MGAPMIPELPDEIADLLDDASPAERRRHRCGSDRVHRRTHRATRPEFCAGLTSGVA